MGKGHSKEVKGVENNNKEEPQTLHKSNDPCISPEGEQFLGSSVLFSKCKERVTKDDFELLHVIGGSLRKVMQVKKKDDGKIYALRVLPQDAIIARKQNTNIDNSILQAVQHPFIVQLHYAFKTKDKLYMVLDYIKGGELFFHLKKERRFPEARVRLYAAEIISAISHLHSLGIVYRDLKPEDILLDDEGHITLTHFGLSRKLQSNESTSILCSTPEFLAPEVLKGENHTTASDWWLLGTLLFEMLTGLPPFYSPNINIMHQKILKGEPHIPTYISPEAKSILEGLLTREVDKRLGTNGRDEVKAHPWFKGLDWEALNRKEIDPPFKPKVKSNNDLSVFDYDPVFTQEKPIDSIQEGGTRLDTAGFEGFTYVAEHP